MQIENDISVPFTMLACVMAAIIGVLIFILV
jgi:hypothetical protein